MDAGVALGGVLDGHVSEEGLGVLARAGVVVEVSGDVDGAGAEERDGVDAEVELVGGSDDARLARDVTQGPATDQPAHRAEVERQPGQVMLSIILHSQGRRWGGGAES